MNDAWLYEAAEFFEWFGEAYDRATAAWGIAPAWIVAGVVIAGLIVNLLRSLGARPRIAASPEPMAAAPEDASTSRPVEVDLGKLLEEVKRPEKAVVTGGGEAPRWAGGVLALVGLAVMAGAGYFMSAAPERAPEWQSSVYLFGSLVALLGLGLANAGMGGLFHPRMPGNDPESWLHDARWSREGTGPVASERIGSGAFGLAIFAAYLVPFHWVFAAPLAQVAFWITLGVLDLVFVVALVFFLQSLRARLLGGRARLRWTEAPFRPGQTLRLRFETGKELDGETTFTLRCLRGGGSGLALDAEPPADAKDVYTEERTLRLQRSGGGGSFADLAFEIPADATPTLRSGDASVWWRLVVRLPMQGPDYVMTFPLPVYGRP